MRLFEIIFFFFYRFLLMPLVLTFVFLWPFNKKIRRGLRLRQTEKLKGYTTESPVWIHASSGEFEYAKPVITELKKRHPEAPIVVTYFSPSYANAIQNFPGVDQSLPLPFDLPGPVHSFIKKLNPRMLLVARTDLWPELLKAVHHHRIPSLLFSTTFRPLKGLRKMVQLYFRFLLNQFTQIFAVAEPDVENLQMSHTSTPIKKVGDTRFDQVLARLENPKPIKLELFSQVEASRIFIAGSTWSEDEAVLLPALEPLLHAQKFKLILAPHEPTSRHLAALIKELKKRNLRYSLYSEAQDFNCDVILVDQVGILAELYTHSHIAFVGGSFKAKVHSVMEPLAAGLVTIVGPHHQNSREALMFKNHNLPHMRLGAVTVAQSSDELRNHLHVYTESLQYEPQTKIEIQNLVRSCSGATEHTLDWIEKNWQRRSNP